MSEAAATAGVRSSVAPAPETATLLDRVRRELSAHGGEPRRAAEACAALIRTVESNAAYAADVYAQVGGLLAAAPNRPAVREVFETLQARALASGAPPALYGALLQVRERPLRFRAVTALALAIEQGLRPSPGLLERLAGALAGASDLPPAAATILQLVAGPGGVPALLGADRPAWLRDLAARCLDTDGLPAAPAHWPLALGDAAANRLAHHLAFTRASHRDLVNISGHGARDVPLLESLDAAEQALGRDRLARVIAELGWSRIAVGLEVTRLVQLRILDGFPVFVREAEARLLEECSGVVRCGTAELVIGHGLAEALDAGASNALQAARIRRFRDYNVAHANLLNEILEVAPVTAGRARSMLDHVTSLADDFAWLFCDHDPEAARAPEAARVLAERLALLLPTEGDPDLAPGTTRLIQGFEDPASLDEVTTVHGLKRYLHQRGLRNAFRLFQSAAAANRSVDLLLVDELGATRVARRIRYIDFEPVAGCGVPPIVRTVAESYARWLVHGVSSLPDTRLLIYAHEVQVYLSFRAHPAFVRLDLSPPRRGGMVDLEYFAVSQNDIEQHPARDLGAIREFLRRLGFFVALQGVRIHARYDKESAFDRADILERVAGLFRLAPLLMDLDWTIGSLAYSRDALGIVQKEWASFFEREGVLPLDALLSAERTRVRARLHPHASEAWDGTGPYADALPPGLAAAWWEELAGVLERHGLPAAARQGVLAAGDAPPGQCELERRLSLPLRGALASGAVVDSGVALTPADPTRYRTAHEAVRMAAVLAGPDAELEDRARLGAIVRNAFTLFRFRTTGTVQGCRVERADLALSVGRVALLVLCDAQGTVRLAHAIVGSTPAQARDAVTGEWAWHAELGTAGVLELLLRDNYVSPATLLMPLHVPPAAELRALFARPALRAPRAPLAGDRVIEAEAAAPGRASGEVRLSHGLTPDHVKKAILAAPVVRAEDALLLHAAAGIVTTGGGILSHAALLALELRKPSLLLRGSWQQDASGALVLAVARTEFREVRQRAHGSAVVCWAVVGEHVEHIRDGDLLAIDAGEGALRLLGQDRTALALHHGLDDLHAVAAQLAGTADHAHVLELRGRLLRTMHGLRRLLRELTSPALAHYVARELVALPDDAPANAPTTEKRELLQVLLANPAVGAHGAAAAAAASREMRARFLTLAAEARACIPQLERPIEIVFLRHAVLRLAGALRTLDPAHEPDTAGDTSHDTSHEASRDDRLERTSEIERLALARLHELRSVLAHRIEACRDPHDSARPHLERQLRVIEATLADGTGEPRLDALHEAAVPDEADAQLAERLTLSGADGGIELAPFIGNKAAGLAEMERLLGAECVPPWFAVTDRAFREMLDIPVGLTARDVSTPTRCTLGDAIGRTLDRRDRDAAQKAAAIAALWRNVSMTPALRERLVAELARIADALPSAGPARGDCAGDVAVAIRSSAFEEDRLEAACAGQFSTFLNVRGAEAVIEHLKAAWAGLWNERALHRRGATAPPPGGGLIVQRMVAARAAGVLHTVSVATTELRTMVANVGLGLGAGIVSGEVGVDEIRMLKRQSAGASVADVQYRIGDKQEQYVAAPERDGIVRVETVYHQRFRAALEYSDVFELATLGLRLESMLGHPLDIEFAFEGDRLLLLQLRPIPVFYHALTETLLRFPFPTRR